MASVNPFLYLDSEQQDLLLAALASNSSPLFLSEGTHQQPSQTLDDIKNYGNSKSSQKQQPGAIGSHEMDTTRPNSAVEFQAPLTELNGVSPVLDGLDYAFDLDGNYDWDQGMGEEYGASVDGSIDTPATVATEHEKRKSPPTDNEDGSPGSDSRQNEPKRREKETDEKVAKKPGRKPLTSEPTSKRKAQNRAAQRAFRERKEKHLKDLEQKVADLEKASETANKENSALRQQIERLQTELNEYRKRLTDKPSVSSILGKGTNGGFQFEFPLFGLKTPTHFGIGSNTKPGHFPQPNNAINGMRFDTGSQGGRARSSTTPSGASTIRPQNMGLTMDSSQFDNTPHTAQEQVPTGFSKYYTPNSRESTSEYLPDGIHTSKPESITSPSSSLSQPGTNSSMTSPESNSHSPLSFKQDQLEPVTEKIVQVLSSEHDEPGFHCGVLDDGETSFCEKLGAIACGNPRNPVPLSPDSKLLPNLNEVIPRPGPRRNSANINVLTHPIGNGFDPMLFRDYRDPMDRADMDLNMSFFDDAFPIDFPLGSPIIPGTPVEERAEPELKKPAPAGLENTEDDDTSSEDEAFMVQAKPDTKLMTCNKIWDRISAHPKFASGELDMDTLCTELRSKAKCSETGVVVGQKDVEEVLSKAGLKPETWG